MNLKSGGRYGAKIIAVSVVGGGVLNQNGLDLFALNRHVGEKKTVVVFTEAEPITNEQLLELPCDILVPAALERQVTEANAGKIHCRILAEAANGPTTPEADIILNQRPEVFIKLPEVLCNAGGVIGRYFEWVQDLQSFFWGETEIVETLFRILETAYTQILSASRKQKIPMRLAALSLGVKRVQEAKRIRGYVSVSRNRSTDAENVPPEESLSDQGSPGAGWSSLIAHQPPYSSMIMIMELEFGPD